MKTITIENESFQIAGEWNELTPEQLVFLSITMSGPVTPDSVKLKLLMYSLGAKFRRYETARQGVMYHLRIGSGSYFLNSLQLCDMAHAFDWLFKQNEDESYSLDVKLTKNPFPEIVTKQNILYGPGDALTNISYGQFVMLQSYQVLLGTDADGLYKFLSIIYKPGKFDNTEDGNPSLLKEVNPNVLRVLIWFYIGSMEFIRNKFPNVFSGGSEDSGAGNVFDNQMRVVDALAGGDVTKKDQVKSAFMYDALYTLEIGIENERKAKRNV